LEPWISHLGKKSKPAAPVIPKTPGAKSLLGGGNYYKKNNINMLNVVFWILYPNLCGKQGVCQPQNGLAHKIAASIGWGKEKGKSRGWGE
jgi:hypothetical protein